MATNTFVPTTSSRTPTYSPPRGGGVDAQGRAQQTAGYEWLDYGTFVPGAGTTRWKTNPPFHAWEAGSHNMPLTKGTKEIVPANIKRGYIRRAAVNVTDIPSQSRLYFMYNPTTITRQYVNYLDQGALDPFNTVFQSGNLVAPPSILDFSFELFFDRQAEATVPGNKGVLVDMEYFDLVVRNVIPGSSNSLPDNGVMMVNPRDITVVFSKDMSVQGRPVNAQIIYEKFTHEMTPTRMRIALTMRVIYMGPVRDITSFVTETVNVDRTIPYDIPAAPEFDFEFNEIEWPSNNEAFERPSLSDSQFDHLDNTEGVGADAAQKAKDRSDKYITKYDKDGRRHDLWWYADCSSFVWGGFADPYEGDMTEENKQTGQSMAEKLGWPSWDTGISTGNIPDTDAMHSTFSTSDMVERLWGFNVSGGETQGSRVLELATTECVKGDVLIRWDHKDHMEPDHVGFFWEKVTLSDGSKGYKVLHAASPSQDVTISTYSSGSSNQYNYAVRVFGSSTGHFNASADEGSDSD